MVESEFVLWMSVLTQEETVWNLCPFLYLLRELLTVGSCSSERVTCKGITREGKREKDTTQFKSPAKIKGNIMHG